MNFSPTGFLVIYITQVSYCLWLADQSRLI